MPEYDLLIKEGMIFDGQRTPRWRGDIAVRDRIIVGMGHLRASDATKVIDASGLHVAPGFVDSHTHYDSQLFWDPYCSTSGWHGVTTVVIGNCGFGFAPVTPGDRERAMLTMARTEAIPVDCMKAGMPWDWVTFPEFLDSIDRARKAVNVLSLVPLNPLLTWVLGLERAKAGVRPTDEEHAELRRLLGEALEAGAGGFSCRRTGTKIAASDYDGTSLPCDVMHSETMAQLAAELGARNTGSIQYTYHNRQKLGEARDPAVIGPHIEEIANISGRPVIWGLLTPSEPQDVDLLLDWIADFRSRGVTIFAQGSTSPLPSTFFMTFSEDTNRLDASPAWREATAGTMESRLKHFGNPEFRAQMVDEASLFSLQAGAIEDWMIKVGMTPETGKFNGMSMKEIAKSLGRTDIVETFLELVLADGLRTKIEVPSPSAKRRKDPAFLRKVLASEAIAGASDGGAHTKYRASGSFPTEIIADYVREKEWMDLEEAHWRLSAFPARCLGVKHRGVLAEGAYADILVYDYENLERLPEEVANDLPGGEWRLTAKAHGYRYILVNGVITIQDDEEVASAPGRLLRATPG